jgi:hypothetical protein
MLFAVSVFLHAASARKTTGIYETTTFSDSLKVSVPLAGDSLKAATGDTNQLKVLNDTIHKNDSTIVHLDSALKKTEGQNGGDENEIKDPINYRADDSIIYDMNTRKMTLYNSADVKYQKIKLDANAIIFDWNTFTLSAQGAPDSSGTLSGNPVFTEDGADYKAKRMAYNFKTKKGKIYEVVTKEGEAYLHSEEVKRNENEEWYGKGSEYTTCDLDHPHFYFKAKKIKLIPDKVMVSGPANLWIGDVPTPLYVPFGIFPVKQGQKSGIIIPEYGEDAVLGFFLRNGGYYWAVNDYLGLKMTGQVSTNGTWGLNLASQYALRYTFTGSLSFSYLRSAPSDPDLPGAKPTNSYSFSWTHTEDPRSLPNSTFGASVQMQSADFYQESRVTDQRLLNTSFNSTINFGHTFVGTPFSLEMDLRHDQNLLLGTIDFTVPTFRLSMSRYTPFKAKIKSDKPKWYENIGISYSFEFQNRLSTFDSILFQQQSLNRMSFAADQNFSIDAPLKVFKYFTLTPSFQYQERTYFKGLNESWSNDTVYQLTEPYTRFDTLNGHIKMDTVWRVNSAHDFTAALSFGTKVTGIFKFKGKYLKAIKHVFTPSVSFNYHPDFGSNFWGYYRSVQSAADGATTRYSVFDPSALYGVPAPGKEGAVVWSLGNNFEMKTFSKTDSVNHEKKMGLLDQVNLSGGYNFVADSLRLLPFNLSVVSAKFFNLINLQFNALFDPYSTDSTNNDVNIFEWTKYHRLLRFSQANVSASLSLHSKQKPSLVSADAPPKFIGDYVSYNPDQIYNFDIPWNFTLNYHFNITHGTYFNPDTILTIQTVSATLDFNLTSHWKIALSTGFDITHRQVTLTNLSVIRDLHCWELTFNWTPALPTFNSQQFSIILHPKSNTLKDLKVQKKNSLQPL